MSDSQNRGPHHHPAVPAGRRRFLHRLGAGAAALAVSRLTAGCGSAEKDAGLPPDPATLAPRADGRPRIPPGQQLRPGLKDMGGQPGNPHPSDFVLRVHGAVKRPFELSYEELLALPRTEQECDVHCVTGWTVLDSHWTGVRLQELAEKAGVKSSARHVIFEAAHGYTANVPLAEALKPNVLVAYRYGGDPLSEAHGAPVRSLVPDLYFWKSAKWLTGIRFTEEDEPGYWEVRGYHNHGDPWLEERYG